MNPKPRTHAQAKGLLPEGLWAPPTFLPVFARSPDVSGCEAIFHLLSRRYLRALPRLLRRGSYYFTNTISASGASCFTASMPLSRAAVLVYTSLVPTTSPL